MSKQMRLKKRGVLLRIDMGVATYSILHIYNDWDTFSQSTLNLYVYLICVLAQIETKSEGIIIFSVRRAEPRQRSHFSVLAFHDMIIR